MYACKHADCLRHGDVHDCSSWGLYADTLRTHFKSKLENCWHTHTHTKLIPLMSAFQTGIYNFESWLNVFSDFMSPRSPLTWRANKTLKFNYLSDWTFEHLIYYTAQYIFYSSAGKQQTVLQAENKDRGLYGNWNKRLREGAIKTGSNIKANFHCYWKAMGHLYVLT